MHANTGIISRAYSGMLFLLILMMLTDFTEFGMKADFSNLKKDPGPKGLWFIVTLSILNVLMQTAISTFNTKLIKWVNLIFALMYTLVMMLHQVNHILDGEGIDYHFFLDLSHHILGIWAIIYSYRWMKIYE